MCLSWRSEVKPARIMPHSQPSFLGLRAKSFTTSEIARASSKQKNSGCELALRRALWLLGLRYRLHAKNLPGCPDIVFVSSRIAIFVDGDFWHGRRLADRIQKLSAGHNAKYWVSKISNNVRRDRQNAGRLRRNGWKVIRVWESDVKKDCESVARSIAETVRLRMRKKAATADMRARGKGARTRTRGY